VRLPLVVLSAFLIVSVAVRAADVPRDYHASVNVVGPTRLDFIFPLANQSPEPTPEWLADYDSTQQRYELFIPPKLDARKPAPLILFVSPAAQPVGWREFEQVCRSTGIVFACPFGAGNECPAKNRIRIVLDVLDDVRRKVEIDPDRTYIGGLSGGGRVACMIAYALPELFGGVIPVCGAERLREEPWLRHRAIDRLSVALITGEKDFNRSEMEKWQGPLLAGMGVRTKTWMVPNLGHAIPHNTSTLREAYRWLEEGVEVRRKLAQQWPGMRSASTTTASREEWSGLVLKEARQRLEQPATLYSGLTLLQGISARWPDLGAAKEAKKILVEYDGKNERPWEEADIAEQKKFLLAEARALDSYAHAPFPPEYAKEKPQVAAAAIQHWRKIRSLDPVSPEGEEAAKKIAELEPLAKDE